MKFIITEAQYKKLFQEEAITVQKKADFKSVGKGGANEPEDVKYILSLLKQVGINTDVITKKYSNDYEKIGNSTELYDMISQYQSSLVFNTGFSDGRIDPGRETISKLLQQANNKEKVDFTEVDKNKYPEPTGENATAEFWLNTPYWNTAMNNRNKFDVNSGENWSGCRVGAGTKSFGKHEVSPCAYKAWTGIEPTPEVMEKLTSEDAKALFKANIFDKNNLGAIKSKWIGAITAHIIAHYGNPGVVKRAITSLGINGNNLIGGINQAISKVGEAQVYNHIIDTLKNAYSSSNSPYKNTFVNSVDKYWKKM